MPSDPPGIKALGEKIDEALTPHAVLGVPRDASSGEIRAAYIELVKEFHPDAHPADPLAERCFLRIQEAYSRLKSPYPSFRAYQAHHARSQRRVLWLALTVFVLTPAAVLIATRVLREVPAPIQVEANKDARSNFTPEAKKSPQATPQPRRHKVKRRKARHREIALAEPKPDINIPAQNTPRPVGVTPQAEPARSGELEQEGRASPADPALASGSIAGARDKETSSSPAEPLSQAPSAVPPRSTKRLQAQKLPGATERLAKAAVENSIRTPSRQSRYGDFSADDVLRSTRMP